MSAYNTFVCAGFVYGAKEGKRLQLFIDDVNLPTPDEHGVQRCNEVGCHEKTSKYMLTDEWKTANNQRSFKLESYTCKIIVIGYSR